MKGFMKGFMQIKILKTDNKSNIKPTVARRICI